LINGVVPALIMSTVAGMSTAIGGLISIFSRRTNTKMLSFVLGFSAGVMVLISFYELLPECRHNLCETLGARSGGVGAVLSLLFGLFLAALIEKAVPEYKPDAAKNNKSASNLARMGFVTAVAITIHNFPEGIATFMAGYSDFRLGLPVTLSISLHNIPEGIACAVPIYYGTGSRLKAFGVSALSGLSEPLGALAAYLILAPFLNSFTLGVIFGAVAGIMIYLSFNELIPASKRYGHYKLSMLGILCGIVLMFAVLEIFNMTLN
jgi:ZIP family zinc transporter